MNKKTFCFANTTGNKKCLVLITQFDDNGSPTHAVVLRQDNRLAEKKYKPGQLTPPIVPPEKILKAISAEMTPPEWNTNFFKPLINIQEGDDEVTQNQKKQQKKVYDFLMGLKRRLEKASNQQIREQIPVYETPPRKTVQAKEKKEETNRVAAVM